MARILRLLQPAQGCDTIADVVTAAGARVLGVDGLAVSLVTGGDLAELLWCSDATTRRFEGLQFTVGQGPGPETIRTGAMVWAPDLARVPSERWAALTKEAPVLGIRAVFCFPMCIGAITVGVLTAVRRTPGPMSDQQTGDATILAAALTARCLGSAPPRLGVPLPADSPHSLQHAVVHQATGMLSVQLAVPLPQALLRLRAYAYGSGRPITDVSRDVVDRRLHLGPGGNGTPPTSVDKD
jgi:hypothetical protein